jgi:hypothetical protein
MEVDGIEVGSEVVDGRSKVSMGRKDLLSRGLSCSGVEGQERP